MRRLRCGPVVRKVTSVNQKAKESPYIRLTGIDPDDSGWECRAARSSRCKATHSRYYRSQKERLQRKECPTLECDAPYADDHARTGHRVQPSARRKPSPNARGGHEDTQSRGPSCLPHYSLQDHLRQADAVCNGLTLNYHVECTVITRVLC
jgi:hypothetical protein